MFDFSPMQIIIVLVIALIVFGPKRLPELGRSLGRGLRDFKDGVSGNDEPAIEPATLLAPAVAESVSESAEPVAVTASPAS